MWCWSCGGNSIVYGTLATEVILRLHGSDVGRTNGGRGADGTYLQL